MSQEAASKVGDQAEGEGRQQSDAKLNQNKKNYMNGKQSGSGKQQVSSPVRQIGRQQQQHPRGQHGQQSYGQQAYGQHGQQAHGQQQRQHMRQNRRVPRNDGKQVHDSKQNGNKTNNQQKVKQGKMSDVQNGNEFLFVLQLIAIFLFS